MEDHKAKNEPWLSVPQFGDWDLKGQVPDYSLDFSKIREMRKQNKRDVSRVSLGNEQELISTPSSTKPIKDDPVPHDYNPDHSPTVVGQLEAFFGYNIDDSNVTLKMLYREISGSICGNKWGCHTIKQAVHVIIDQSITNLFSDKTKHSQLL